MNPFNRLFLITSNILLLRIYRSCKKYQDITVIDKDPIKPVDKPDKIFDENCDRQ